MDDLQLFISSKARMAAVVGADGYRTSYREHESLDLSRTVAETAELHYSLFPTNDDPLAWPRQDPSQGRHASLLDDKKQQARSKWHRALERLEEKRKWRRTSAKLSEAFGTWSSGRKAKDGRDADVSPEIAYAKASEGRVSIKATALTLSETKDVTKIEQTVIEIHTVPADDGDDWKSLPSDDDTATVPVDNKDDYDEPPKISIIAELSVKNEHVSFATPDRSTHTLSSTTTTPWTPDSNRSQSVLDFTPDTPESVLRPSQGAKITPEPGTPTPNPFGFTPLPDDIFTPQIGHYSRGPGGRLRPSHLLTSNKPLSSRSKNTSKITQHQAASPSVQIEASTRLFPSHEGITKVETPALEGRADHTISSKATVTLKQEHTPFRSEGVTVKTSVSSIANDARETLAKATSASVSPLQSTSINTSPGAIVAKRKSKFANGLQAYDRATGLCAREQFRADPTSCYGWAKTRGKRCTIRTIKGREASIREAIEKLETSDPETDYEGCLRLIEDLAKLTLCEVTWSQTWRGHKDGVNRILRDCKSLLADCRPSASQTLIAEVVTVNQNASNSQLVITTTDTIDTLFDTFTGFEPWQPPNSAQKGVSTYLRELITTPLDREKEDRGGYIYAYRTQGIFGHVKIGYTGRDIDTRLAEWRVKCRHVPVSVLGSMNKVPHVARIEALIHAELKDCRRIQTKCICDTTHIEWFEASPNVVRGIVEKWSAWMESEPYDTRGSLKPQNYQQLDEICRPTALRAGTSGGAVALDKHVRSLEQPFSFLPSQPAKAFGSTNMYYGARSGLGDQRA